MDSNGSYVIYLYLIISFSFVLGFLGLGPVKSSTVVSLLSISVFSIILISTTSYNIQLKSPIKKIKNIFMNIDMTRVYVKRFFNTRRKSELKESFYSIFMYLFFSSVGYMIGLKNFTIGDILVYILISALLVYLFIFILSYVVVKNDKPSFHGNQIEWSENGIDKSIKISEINEIKREDYIINITLDDDTKHTIVSDEAELLEKKIIVNSV